MTLTDFLLARIAADETAAKNVVEGDYSEGRWHWDLHRGHPYRSALVNDRGAVVLPPKNDDVYPSAAVAEHIARHDPARVLAECEAKRRIVETATGQHTSSDEGYEMMRIIATVYADHEDYDESWRP